MGFVACFVLKSGINIKKRLEGKSVLITWRSRYSKRNARRYGLMETAAVVILWYRFLADHLDQH